MKKWCTCIAMVLLSTVSFAQLELRVKELAEKHYQVHSFSGIVGILDTSVAVAVSSGYEDAAKSIPVSQYSSFSLASVTKVFTGMAALHYIQKGALAHDDTIGKWFPELKPQLRLVTIRQLANHTAAIHDFYSLTERANTLNDSSAFELLIALDTAVYQPGMRYGYSNSHYLLLALILEKVSGQPFEELIAELFLEPMKMTGAGFYADGARAIPGYLDNGRKAVHMSTVSGEAGLIVSANDMLAFGRSLLLDEESKALIMNGLEHGQVYDPDPKWTYAYGWFCTIDKRGPFCACSGKGFGALAYLRWYYESDQYYFLLSNREDFPSFKAYREDIATLLPQRKQ